METIKQTCQLCRKEFLIIEPEKKLLDTIGLPLPIHCPTCRQTRRLQDRGDRQLFKTVCQSCQKNIVVTYNPQQETRKILCKQCYLEYFEKNSAIIP